MNNSRMSAYVGLGMIGVEVLYSASAIGTQILLTNSDDHVIVDMGDGTVRDLVSRKIDFDSIKAILLTHEHFDHFSGLYGFLHFCRLLRRKEELVIAAPSPIRVINHLFSKPMMYEQLPYDVHLRPMTDGESFGIGKLNVTAFSVDHRGASALGYSIVDEDGYKVVFSGDTALCENLQKHLVGAELAVLEATYDDSFAQLATKYGHMTKSQAADLGKAAGDVKYIHANPDEYFRKFTCSA